MRHFSKLFTITILLFILVFSACSTTTTIEVPITATPFQPIATVTTVALPEEPSLFISNNIPTIWQSEIRKLENVRFVDDEEEADLILTPTMGQSDDDTLASFTRVYAVAVPFFTIDDEIKIQELSTVWQSQEVEAAYPQIFVSSDTRSLLTGAWGEPGNQVVVGEPTELLALVQSSSFAYAIIPFEEISPRWKILKIDGISPLDKPFKQDKYPLVVSYDLIPVSDVSEQMQLVADELKSVIPFSNRDESKMTVLVMSGTTAITRGLAYKITINSTDYPIALVKDWFLSADLRHVSNESPFVEDCPPPDPYTSSLVFCTSPDMIEVLEKIGINVVELTGNHIKDYLDDNLLYTMQLYRDEGWGYYAAGENEESARKPLLIENNGNKIAFIGCNAVGPSSVWAKSDKPGAAQCDFEYLTNTISELKAKGYTVITTFQHEELTVQDGSPTVLMFAEKISQDFQSAALAGADIVQGSQAHYPMGFEFIGDSLIHYGLGNFLFDQMWDPNRNEFIDRHIIYDGKYINTELLTAVLMDWSQPNPMTKEQRANFLAEIFEASLVREK